MENNWIVFGPLEQYRANSDGVIQTRIRPGGRGVLTNDWINCNYRKDRTDKYGGWYLTVSAYIDKDGPRCARVHTLICRLFHGKRPTPKHQVNHIDGDRANNSAKNLEWVTHSENMKNAKERNAWKDSYLEASPISDIEQILAVYTQMNIGITNKELSRRYGIDISNFSRIKTGDIRMMASFRPHKYLNKNFGYVDNIGGITEDEWKNIYEKSKNRRQ